MAKSDPSIDELRKRLTGLLADWETEISTVVRLLDDRKAAGAVRPDRSQSLDKSQTHDHSAAEQADLQQRIRDRDLALDYVKKKLKEKDQQFLEFEKEREKSRIRIEELERKLGESGEAAAQPKGGQQAELEAMRAELAARKSLVKSLRADAERGKALEKELAENRKRISNMGESIERHARTIVDLRRNAESWEEKYRRLEASAAKAPAVRVPSAAAPAAKEAEVDGSRTIVIDMTESLRAARDERLKKNRKR